MRRLALTLLLSACGAGAASPPPRTATPPDEPTAPSVRGAPPRRLAMGDGFGCALLPSGPTCWGVPPFGHDVEARSAEPLRGAVELSAESFRLCARFDDGSVRCWDQDPDDPAEGTVTSPPIPPARRVWASDPPCALTEDDELWCWSTERVEVAFEPVDPEIEAPVEEDDLVGEMAAEEDSYAAWEARPRFGRVATLPGAIDVLVDGTETQLLLDAAGLHVVADGEIGEGVEIAGARALARSDVQVDVFVLVDGGTSARVRVGYRGLEVEPGPAMLDVAHWNLLCVLDGPDRATCSTDETTIPITGPTGMDAIASNDTSACVLTAAGEVFCVDVGLPPAVFELAAASTGVSEVGHTVCATSEGPWTCLEQMGIGGPMTWTTRPAECTGASWLSGEPGPGNVGWLFCGSELRATVLDFDDGDDDETREIRIPGVARVHGIESGLALTMTNGGVRLFPTSTGWGEYATLAAPLDGFSRMRDFDQEATHRCAVTHRGTVVCQSANPYSEGAPVAVAELADVAEIETAAGCACARTAAGEVRCFDLEYDATASPLRDAGLTGVTHLVGHNDQICALDASHVVSCTTNDVTSAPSHTPREEGEARCGAFAPTVLDDVEALEAGDSFVCARRASGRVLCWGNMSGLPHASDVEAGLAPDRTPVRVAP